MILQFWYIELPLRIRIVTNNNTFEYNPDALLTSKYYSIDLRNIEHMRLFDEIFPSANDPSVIYGFMPIKVRVPDGKTIDEVNEFATRVGENIWFEPIFPIGIQDCFQLMRTDPSVKCSVLLGEINDAYEIDENENKKHVTGWVDLSSYEWYRTT